MSEVEKGLDKLRREVAVLLDTRGKIMNQHRLALIPIICLVLSNCVGCAIVEIGVTNPAPNLTRIAVAPFVNLSPERNVDGRRFAEAYYTELQKTPGFQVIPVGVVETAVVENNLNLDSPQDLLKLVEFLDADAIVSER